MIWLLCGLMLAASLFYVFYLPGRLFLGPEKTRAGYLRERKDAVYENLRDLNFEYKAGKVPDVDYQSLKSSLRTRQPPSWPRLPAWKIPRRHPEKQEPERNPDFETFISCHRARCDCHSERTRSLRERRTRASEGAAGCAKRSTQ